MKKLILPFALALSAAVLTARAQDPKPAGGDAPAPAQAPDPGSPAGFHLLPPNARPRLHLSADQTKQLDTLEAETTANLQKILTPQQFKQLAQMRPPGRRGGPGGPDGRGGPGGHGGPDGQGGPGGLDGQNGPPPPQ